MRNAVLKAVYLRILLSETYDCNLWDMPYQVCLLKRYTDFQFFFYTLPFCNLLPIYPQTAAAVKMKALTVSAYLA